MYPYCVPSLNPANFPLESSSMAYPLLRFPPVKLPVAVMFFAVM